MNEYVPDKFVTIEDLAKVFVISVSTARSWVRTGAIPKSSYIKIGHTYRFNLRKVVEALAEQVENDKQAQEDEVSVAEDQFELEPEIVPTQLELEFDLDKDA